MQKLQPWQYIGVNEDTNSQPYPTPESFIKTCQVGDVDTARAMQSLILEQLCNQPHSAKKTTLLQNTLRLLEKKYL